MQALVLLELRNKQLLDRLHRSRCKDGADPAWYLTLRTYWDKDLDEVVLKQARLAWTQGGAHSQAHCQDQSADSRGDSWRLGARLPWQQQQATNRSFLSACLQAQGPATFRYGYEPLRHPLPSFLRTQEAESSFLALTAAHLVGHCASLGAQPGSGQSSILEVGKAHD